MNIKIHNICEPHSWIYLEKLRKQYPKNISISTLDEPIPCQNVYCAPYKTWIAQYKNIETFLVLKGNNNKVLIVLTDENEENNRELIKILSEIALDINCEYICNTFNEIWLSKNNCL